MNVYTKPCGCEIRMHTSEEPITKGGRPYVHKRWEMFLCEKHEVVPVLREKGDTGLLGPKEPKKEGV